MRELQLRELAAVSGGRRMERLDGSMSPMQLDPGDNGGGIVDLPPIIVTAPGGGGWSFPGGSGGSGGGGGSQPPFGGGGSGGGPGANPGGNADPLGIHGHFQDGLGQISAQPIFDNMAHVTGAKFGLDSYGNNGAVSFQNGGATLMDTYTMSNGAKISGSLSYLNGHYTETLSGSDQFGGLKVDASFNTSNFGSVHLDYQASPGVALSFDVNTNGMVKGSGSVTLYEANGWKVQARSDIGSGSWGPTDQASIYVTHSGPQPQYFSFAVGNSSTRGIYFEGGINIPFN